MDIPDYIRDMLARSQWAVHSHLPEGCDPGYTIRIYKRTSYAHAKTLRKETEDLEKWCRRQMNKIVWRYNWEEHPKCIIHDVPEKTAYRRQYALVTIYDPIMKHIEHLIPGS